MATSPAGPVRVLCIAGSPRRSGNSAALLDACAAGVIEAGGVVDRISLAARPVRPCSGCSQCSPTGECVLNDEMREYYPLIDAADAIVVASPVYFAGVPATLKAFYDRCQPYWARRYVLGRSPRPVYRPGALLLARGGGDPFGPDCAVTTTRSVFAVLETEILELIDVEGPDNPGEIEAYSESLVEAHNVGVRLVGKAAERAARDV